MILSKMREFIVRDKFFNLASEKDILDPQTQLQIGIFESESFQWHKTYRLLDMDGECLLGIKEKGLSFQTTFLFYEGMPSVNFELNRYTGSFIHDFSFFTKFHFEDPEGNSIFEFKGDFWGRSYKIRNYRGICAQVSKEFWTLQDTYGVKINSEVSDFEAMQILSMVAVLDFILDRRRRNS